MQIQTTTTGLIAPHMWPALHHESAIKMRREETHDDGLAAWDDDRDFVMSFARGLEVIRAFDNKHRPQTIADISHSTQIPRAAVRRLLHTLTEMGYVRCFDSKYSLTHSVLTMGHAFLGSEPLHLLGQPILTHLSDDLACFCALMVPADDDAMIICAANLRVAKQLKTLYPTLGSRAPLYCCASGLLFLSTLNDEALEAYLYRALLHPYTHRTPTDVTELRERVRRAREQRFVVMDRTFTQEHRSVAVPVLNRGGHIVAAMVAVTNAERVSSAELLSQVMPKVASAARELSARLA